MIALGSNMKSDSFHEELIISSLLGVSFVGAFLVVGSSFILPILHRIIYAYCQRYWVLIIGLSLIKVGIIDFGGGFAAKSSSTSGNYEHIGVRLLVLIVVIGFNCCRSPLLRMGGNNYWAMCRLYRIVMPGHGDLSSMRNLPLITIPHPFKYGFSFSFHQFLVVGTIYLLSVLKQSAISPPRQWFPAAHSGKEYQSRLKGGVLADGLVYVIASAVGSLPLTTFAQNNGVIE
ncbi:solute carrier family 23 protein [Shigella flexneri]